MATKKEIILEYGKWIFDRQNTELNMKRDKIFTLGSLTLGILSIASGIMAVYISLGKTNSVSFSIFCASITLLIISLIICFWNFKSIKYEDLTFFKEEIDKLKRKTDENLLNELIRKVRYAYTVNENKYFPKELKKDNIIVAFLLALILDFISIILLILIGIIEFIN